MIYISAVFFLIYLVDVIIGAMGGTRFLSDVQECIVLMISTLFFVIDILRRQRRWNKEHPDHRV